MLTLKLNVSALLANNKLRLSVKAAKPLDLNKL